MKIPGSWLNRHPMLAAEWLQVRARARRTSPILLLVMISIVVSVLMLLRQASRARDALAVVDAHWPIVFALSALSAAAHVARRRKRLVALHSRSWLAAAPIAPADLQLALVIRVFAPVIGGIVAAMLAALMLSDAASGSARVITCLGAGALIGAIAGWIDSRRPRRRAYEASRYAPQVAHAPYLTPSSAGLSHWPIAQAFAWGRPENLRTLVVICLLLGVQAGASALHGLLIVSAWLLAGYLGSLLLAAPHAARAAARWLRSTPLDLAQFAWAVMRRALLHQAVGAIVAALVMSAMGAPLPATAYICALWLCIVALVYSLSVVDAYRGRAPTVKIVLSLAAMAAVESRAHAWSIPAIFFVTVWRLRSLKT